LQISTKILTSISAYSRYGVAPSQRYSFSNSTRKIYVWQKIYGNDERKFPTQSRGECSEEMGKSGYESTCRGSVGVAKKDVIEEQTLRPLGTSLIREGKFVVQILTQ
jgi:hypothetical protein